MLNKSREKFISDLMMSLKSKNANLDFYAHYGDEMPDSIKNSIGNPNN